MLTIVRVFCPFIVAAVFSAGSVVAQQKPGAFADMARKADAVVVGKVTTLHSEWSADRSRIFTRVTIGVDQYLKGSDAGGSITLLTPGGEIGGVGEVYSHMPTFRADENVVVFVEKDAQGQYRVCQGSLGKYTIEKDQHTGRELVSGVTPLVQFAGAVRHALQNTGAR